MASVKKLTPDDARKLSKTAQLNGNTYHYLLSQPSQGPPKATIFLIHGWPDCSFGWRYQIPFLTHLGFRVVVPDMMGYGGTDAPHVPPNDIHLYGMKRAADNIAALAKHLGAPRIILGGHDWGGMVVYRTAQWYPDLVSHIFAVCTPYARPEDRYISTEALANGPVPQFGYQVFLASGKVEAVVRGREQVKQFLQGMYGGRVPEGRQWFNPKIGCDLDLIGQIGKSPLFEDHEMDYLADEFSRHGLHGTLNWYRTRRANFDDDRNLTHRAMDFPVLFIFANRDNVLTADLKAGMRAQVPKLTEREVSAGHWALTQAPAEVNGHIKEWLDDVVFGGQSKL